MGGRFARFLAGIAVAALAAAPTRAAEVDFGRYRALVIGINDYQHLPKLETPVNDASALHDVLRRQYGFESTLLLNPTRYALVSALDSLRGELDADSNLLIYFAGHGSLDRQTRRGYWLPVDAEPENTANWLSNATITDALSAMAAKHVLVVADSCYSGTLTRDAGVVPASGKMRQAELQRIAGKRARKVLASGGIEPVADDGGDGHSVFTRALLEVLQGNREVLDGYQLYARLRPVVIKGSEQTPVYADVRLAGDEDGDFLLVPAGSTAVAASEPAPAELAFWRTVEASDDPADARAYLQRYPDGSFAALARNRLARLETASRPAAVAGLWKTDALDYSAGAADVRYVFELQAVGDRLVGTVGFGFAQSDKLTQRGILDGTFTADGFSFRTAHTLWSLEVEQDDKGNLRNKRTATPYSVIYTGTVAGDEMRIVRQDDRGGTPEAFVARRADEK